MESKKKKLTAAAALITTFAFAIAVLMPAAANAQLLTRTVTVQSGDTLSGISLREYGNASLYPAIARVNNIANPNLIFPGQVLTIPTLSEAQRIVGTIRPSAGVPTTTDGILGGTSNLGELFILSELFGDDGDTDFEDLFVLDRLFSGTGTIGGGLGTGNLGDLFILDKLFGDDGNLFGDSGIGDGDDNDLKDLIILENLFGGTGTGNLSNLFIMDQLFD